VKTREKILAIGLAGVFLAWQGGPFLYGLVMGPIDELSSRISTLNQKLDEEQAKKRSVDKAIRNFRDYKNRSLPPNPTLASTEYQGWLYEQAIAAGLRDVSVSPMNSSPTPIKGTYYQINFEVKGRGKLKQFAALLVGLKNSGLLHRVGNFSLEADDSGSDPDLKVSLKLEALCLLQSPARARLFAEKAPSPGTESVAELASLSARNVFEKFKPPEPEPVRTPERTPAPPPPEEPFDEAEFTVLTGVLFRDGVGSTYLYNQSNNQSLTLKVGDKFTMAGLEGEVREIHADHVFLLFNGLPQKIEVGETLRAMADRAALVAASEAPAGKEASTDTNAGDSSNAIPGESNPSDSATGTPSELKPTEKPETPATPDADEASNSVAPKRDG
jgi:hypothetical protein